MKLRICEVMQDKDKLTEEKIKEVLERNCIVKYAYILHDKDTDKEGQLVRAHWHIMLKFDVPQDTKYIAKWFEIQENYIEKCKTNFTNMLKYLTHDNAPGKHSYDDSEVKSNFEVEKAKQTPISDDRLDEILDMIDSGRMREFNISEYVTLKEYTKYKRQIKDSMEYVNARIGSEVKREMEVMFVTGTSGSGKTTFAIDFCEDKKLSYFVSDGGKNPLDGYKGQDVVILDDLRPSDYKYSELLKMLDNNTGSNVACRYYNKSMMWCKYIIITSILPIEDWYRGLQEHEVEPLVQLKRRCKTYIRMTKESMFMSLYLPSKKDYSDERQYVNPVMLKYATQSINEDEAFNMLESLLGNLAMTVKDSRKQYEEYKQLEIGDINPFDETNNPQ